MDIDITLLYDISLYYFNRSCCQALLGSSDLSRAVDVNVTTALYYGPAAAAHSAPRGCAARGKGRGMAKLVFGMNQSLDGYVDHTAFAPGPTLFRHFIEE